MKIFRHLHPYLLGIGLLICFSSCEKEAGPQGPQGIPGTAGPAGSQGQEGKAGADGTKILSGFTPPNQAMGQIGDFYLDLNSSTLYGPKDVEGWNNNLELKGHSGKNGSTILSGYASPTPILGEEGDFFIDLSTMDFYGPKSWYSGWGTPISLKSKQPLMKRVLMKENMGYSESCEQCGGYSPMDNAGYSSLSISNAYERIKTGDISEYYDHGIVLYEAKVNSDNWIELNPKSNEAITVDKQYGSDRYFITFIPIITEYSRTYHDLFISLTTSLYARGNYTKSQLLSMIKRDIRVDVRITLLPNESIEYLAQQYPDHTIDTDFLTKYMYFQ